MTQTVNVPNVGDFEFPDGMSQKDMQSAIETHISGTKAKTPSIEPPLFGHIRSAAGLGLGALQGVAQLGHGLGQLETGGVNKLMALLGHPTHFHAPEPDVFAGPAAQLKGGMPAQIGEAAGQLGGIAALGGGLGGAAKIAGAAPWLAETLGFGTAGAATTPGGVGERAIASGLGAAFPVAGKAVTKVGRAFLPKHLSSDVLGKLIGNTLAEQKTTAKGLYKDAFQGTENIKPVISGGTTNAFNEMMEMPAGKLDVKRSLQRFFKNPTLEGLHGLKSNFGKIEAKLVKKAGTPTGLMGEESDKRILLNEGIENIENDLSRNMSNVSPDSHLKYLKAQNHWKENVVPFQQLSSVRKLIGPEKEVSRKLFTEISKKAKSPERLRELMDLDRGALGARGLSRIAGLGLLGGLGYGGHHYLHSLLGGF